MQKEKIKNKHFKFLAIRKHGVYWYRLVYDDMTIKRFYGVGSIDRCSVPELTEDIVYLRGATEYRHHSVKHANRINSNLVMLCNQLHEKYPLTEDELH